MVAMIEKYEVGCDNGIMTVDFSESPSLRDVKDLVDQVPLPDGIFLRLWDLNNCSLEWSIQDVREFAQYEKSRLFSGKHRFALVAHKPAVFGMLRVFSVHRQHGDQIEVKVFRNRWGAMEWLGEERCPMASEKVF